MISLAFALCVQQAVLKDVHIPAMPLEKAVDQLATIYNSPMDISTLLRGKVILIDATQVSESEVREQIGKTLNASWEKKEGFWHLGKSNKQQAADVQRGVTMRSRFLKKTLEIRQKALDDNPELTKPLASQVFLKLRSDEEQRRANPNQMQRPGPSPTSYGLPGQRFLTRFLLKFGMNRIAAIPNGHRVVFAMHPNAMQSDMRIDISEIVTRYRKEQDFWRMAMEPILTDKEGLGKGSDDEKTAAYEKLGDEINSSFGAMPTDLKDILFTVFCSENGAYDFKIIGIPKGEEPNFSYKINGTSYEGAFAGMEASDFETKPVEGFRLSQESEDFKNFRENQIAKIPESRRAAVLEKLADPVKRDPLSYALTESLVFDMRRFKHNLIAVVGDNLVNIAEPIYGDMIFGSKHFDIFQDFLFKDDKWVRMMETPFPEPNIPRIELKRLFANVRANKKVSIWDRAAIASVRPRTRAYSYIEGMLDTFAGTVHEGYNDADALKLIGLLSESDRAAATGPNGIRFSQLNSRAQQHLFECCYYNQDNRIWSIQPSTKKWPPYAVNEPTYMSPVGITGDATLKITEQTSEKIKEPEGAGSQNITNDANGWGQIMYQVEHPEEFPGNTYTFDKTRKLFRLKVTNFDMNLRFNADCQWQSRLTSAERVDKATFTIGSLPADLKEAFEAGYKAASQAAKLRRERLKNKGDGGGFTRQNKR